MKVIANRYKGWYGLPSTVGCRQTAGFTLIELLVAMSILMVIVLMLANVFQQSTRSWGIGMQQAEVGLEARAAINRIQQDLSQAVASSNRPATFLVDSMTFEMFSNDPHNLEALELVEYSELTSGGGLERTRNATNSVELLQDGTMEFSYPAGFSTGSGVTELPAWVEVKLTVSESREMSLVRVYAVDHEYKAGSTEYVDTHR